MYKCKLFVDGILLDENKPLFHLNKLPKAGLVVQNNNTKFEVTEVIKRENEVEGIVNTIYELRV